MYSGSVIPDGIGGVKKVEKAIMPDGTVYELSAYLMSRIDVGLREVFLKGDNAGCYHSTCLVAYLSHLNTLSPNEVIELFCLHRRIETSRIAEHREKWQSDGTGTKNPTTEVSIETDGKFYNRS
ncbi:Hypothetical predicted protein [Mytilus galloprovincialis]|uniref:Uncharacterized protein n=1 Tax=Mytilus galloprovincialis TaxID=29158 RepID=A0A8B6FY12_MYTGA|nr:Hypothetical predicted protein [Mytilus galloprovincialis]